MPPTPRCVRGLCEERGKRGRSAVVQTMLLGPGHKIRILEREAGRGPHSCPATVSTHLRASTVMEGVSLPWTIKLGKAQPPQRRPALPTCCHPTSQSIRDKASEPSGHLPSLGGHMWGWDVSGRWIGWPLAHTASPAPSPWTTASLAGSSVVS